MIGREFTHSKGKNAGKRNVNGRVSGTRRFCKVVLGFRAMTSPQSPQPADPRPSPKLDSGAPLPSGASPAGGTRPSREGALPRLPLFLRILAVLTLCTGLWGAMTSLAELNASLFLDRSAFVLRVRDRQVLLHEQLQTQRLAPGQGQDLLQPLLAPFLKLPRAEAERLSLLLGDALYERRGVTVPLGLLQLILSWLLISGSLATLRRQSWGMSMLSFGCWASICFALLSMLVTFVHSRTLMDRLGQPLAAALAQANGHGVEMELAGLWQLTRLYVLFCGAINGLWVLLLGGTVLVLQRIQQKLERIRPQRLPSS